MKFKLEIDMVNAAFDGNPSRELARLLTVLVGNIKRRPAIRKLDEGRFTDINGNRVGTWEVTE